MSRENVWYRAVRMSAQVTLFHAVMDGHESLITTAYTVCQCADYARAGGFILETVRHEEGVPVFECRHPDRSMMPVA